MDENEASVQLRASSSSSERGSQGAGRDEEADKGHSAKDKARTAEQHNEHGHCQQLNRSRVLWGNAGAGSILS